MSSEQHPSQAEKWGKRFGYAVVIGACAVGWWYDTFQRAPDEEVPPATVDIPHSPVEVPAGITTSDPMSARDEPIQLIYPQD